ncbi:MAG: DNA adenine methylase [Thermodesulfovibrionia bacterium]|nr:DNA adenine methylase [Thermodesulfovibrionia bacterium]
MSIKNKSKITEKLEWGKFVSPLSDRNIVPFNWYGFKHRFGSELVSKIFSMFDLSEGDAVLDPFCGGGTTLIKSRLDGYNAVGLDISPFSTFLSNVLTTTYDASKLKKSFSKISHEINHKVEIPDVAILQKSFSSLTLKYIYSLRDSINSLNSPGRDFFLFSLLSILDGVSKAKKSGGFLRITDNKKVTPKVVQKIFIESSEKLINDIKFFKYSGASTSAIVGDARKYPDEVKNINYDAILTSPPYPNRHDYTRIYELELLVGFISNNQSLKQLRYETLRSHVEAKKKFEGNGYVRPLLLEEKINELNNRELNNTHVLSTLEGYFEDMYLSLKEMSGVLKAGKHVGLVVSNVRFAGVMIPVDELLAEIGEQVGLHLQYIYVLRYRGNSSQQMLRHKREPSRESLIVWKK